jgi:hypothetical protein
MSAILMKKILSYVIMHSNTLIVIATLIAIAVLYRFKKESFGFKNLKGRCERMLKKYQGKKFTTRELDPTGNWRCPKGTIPTGCHWDNTTDLETGKKQCVAVKKCPPGFVRGKGGQCKPISNEEMSMKKSLKPCPPGFFRRKIDKQCVPSGKKRPKFSKGGDGSVDGSIMCKIGMEKWDGTRCVPHAEWLSSLIKRNMS